MCSYGSWLRCCVPIQFQVCERMDLLVLVFTRHRTFSLLIGPSRLSETMIPRICGCHRLAGFRETRKEEAARPKPRWFSAGVQILSYWARGDVLSRGLTTGNQLRLLYTRVLAILDRGRRIASCTSNIGPPSHKPVLHLRRSMVTGLLGPIHSARAWSVQHRSRVP